MKDFKILTNPNNPQLDESNDTPKMCRHTSRNDVAQKKSSPNSRFSENIRPKHVPLW